MTKRHNADDWEAAVVAEAVSWTAFQFRGAQNRVRRDAATREEAVAWAQALVLEYPRAVLVYGVSAAGRTALAETVRP